MKQTMGILFNTILKYRSMVSNANTWNVPSHAITSHGKGNLKPLRMRANSFLYRSIYKKDTQCKDIVPYSTDASQTPIHLYSYHSRKNSTVETLYSTIYYSKYFIELSFDKSTQYVALWTHKRHPIPRPFGRAMECRLWALQQKLTVL